MKTAALFLLISGLLSGFIGFIITPYDDPAMIPGLMFSLILVLAGIGCAILAKKEEK